MRIKTALIAAAALAVSAIPGAASAQTSFGISISSGSYGYDRYGYDRYGYDYDYPRYVYAYPSRYYRADRHRHWDRGRHWGRDRHWDRGRYYDRRDDRRDRRRDRWDRD